MVVRVGSARRFAARGRTCLPGATVRRAARGSTAAEAVLHTIGVIAGDGVGPEVVREGLAVLADAAGRESFGYELRTFDLGGERYLATGEVLPDPVLEDLRACDALFLGAVGHPGVPPGV